MKKNPIRFVLLFLLVVAGFAAVWAYLSPTSTVKPNKESSTEKDAPSPSKANPGESLVKIEIPPSPRFPIGRLLRTLGDDNALDTRLHSPMNLTVGKDGSIFAADTGKRRVCKYSPEGKLLLTFKTPPSIQISLQMPTDVAVGPEGKVFVADNQKGDIKVFSPEGHFIKAYKGNLRKPTYMDLRKEVLFVTDSVQGRVVRVGLDGTDLGHFGQQGEKPGQMKQPSGIAVSPEGLVHVVDTGNSRVQLFKEDGTWVDTWAFPSPLQGRPLHPAALDPKGRLYVLEYQTHLVHVFDSKGDHLGFWHPGLGERSVRPAGITINALGNVHMTTRDGLIKIYEPIERKESVRASSGGKPCSPSHQVILIGMDGAEWSTLIALAAQNKLPNIQRLMNNGAYGYLATLCPTATPAIWTSIATSLNPEDHGIIGWVLPVYEEAGSSVCLMQGRQETDVLFCCELKAPKEIQDQTMEVSCGSDNLETVEVANDWQIVKIPIPKDLANKPQLRINLKFKEFVIQEEERKRFLEAWARHVDYDYKRSFVDDDRVPVNSAMFKRIWIEDPASGETLGEIDTISPTPPRSQNRLLEGWEKANTNRPYSIAGRPRRRPLSSNDRKVPALWNMFTAYGKTVGLVGYFVTWPAEKLNGINVTLKTTFRKEQHRNDMVEHLTFPEDYIKRIEPLLDFERPLDDHCPNYCSVAPFVKKKNIIRQVETVYKQDIVNEQIALQVLSDMDPNFFALYLEATDIVAHMFYDQHNEERFNNQWLRDKFTEPLPMKTLANVINEAFTTTDTMIGHILEKVDPEATILIVSDHGFIYAGEQHWYAPPGAFIASGKNIASVGEILDASVYDIAPTILYLAGLPVAKNMLGKPLAQAIEPTYLDKYPLRCIDKYEDRESVEGKPVESVLDEALMQRFKDLGYIQ